ncbi:hypothetical protein NQD34_013918, partial [Periophthalmus magnuspinnatus]
FIGVASSVLLHIGLDGPEQLCDLQLVVPVWILTVFPVFTIKHMTAPSTFLHQGPQSLILFGPVFNVLPLFELVSMSEDHSGVFQSLFREMFQYFFHHFLLLSCVSLHSEHEQKGVRSRGALLDALQDLWTHLRVVQVRVKQTWSVDQTENSSVYAFGL